jgi:DDE superfamily endonuclease
VGQPVHQAHEYERGGVAKLFTLLHPGTGQVRVQGVISSSNAVLHPWLKAQLSAIVQALPPVGLRLDQPVRDQEDPDLNRAQWQRWQEGLSEPFTLLDELPRLRLLLILDNLAGHKTPQLVCWMMAHGIMPLYTPLGGSWLNMAESIQRILTRRALAGEHPQNAAEIIAWLEATARAWNRAPTPFVWGGKRKARRDRAYARRHGWQAVGGSGACLLRLLGRPKRAKPVPSEGLLERLCA